jgi:hypothetical protein
LDLQQRGLRQRSFTLASAGANLGAALFDSAGHTRIYQVPAGWTEDLLLHGGSAWRTLDLALLGPQAGFASTATAAEAPGFQPGSVVRIEVELGSSGAVDELRWDPHPD